MKHAVEDLKKVCCLLIGMALVHQAKAQDFSDFKSLKPFSWSGSMEARSIFYSASGIADRRQPLSYLFSGSPTIGIYGVQIPVSFSFSESDRSFRQPFNQFGMSPAYKWITLHAGYRNVSFSPYTLGGHTMLGAGFELTPGKWRAGFMYGRLNRATTIDTTTQALVPFSFSRKGYAAKLGYGSSANFFELSYLSAKDDEATRPDGLPPQLNTVSAAKNDVLGYTFKFGFFKHFFVESNGAFSLYTTDIHSPVRLDSVDNNFLQKARRWFGINGSSEYYTALSAGAGYKSRNYGLKINYKRIEPDFKTMGAYFFNSDLENWTISPSAVLLKGKIRFNGSIGLQHDNLRQQKAAQNNRVIASANAGLDLSQYFGLDVIYTNFSDNQKAQTALFADSLRIVQTTQTIGFMPRYFIVRPNITHVISGSANFSSLKDYNNYFSAQSASRDISTNQYFLNYNINLTKQQLGLYINLSSTALKGQDLENTFIGATLGGNAAFLNQKMQTGLSFTYTDARGNSSGDSHIINASGNLGYLLRKNHRLALTLFLTSNNASSLNLLQSSFTESRAELSYQLNF